MKRLLIALMLMTVFSVTAAMPVWAYSYGDPNEEELATMFKDATAKIQSEDWAGATAVYQAKRSEIESHFGAGVAVTLDRNLEAKDKAAADQNLKALLVLNLERRFEYGAADIEDYSKSKLLLAKARATYDALEPYIQAKLPNETAKLRTAFDAALEALGNPGLFGVGKKPINKEEYDKQTSYILNTVRPLFPYKAAQAPATPAPTAAPAEKPAAAQTTSSAAAPAATKAPQATAAPAASAQPEASAAAEASAEASASPSPEASVSPAASDAASATPSPEASAEATAAPATTTAAAEGHAPMKREDKTNTGITFAVIGVVAAAAGGTFWWARRKGMI